MTIGMTCQTLFSEENKKNKKNIINFINLSTAELAKKMVKVKMNGYP